MVKEIIRADLHTHNWFSKDSIASPHDVVVECQRKGINCIAITNHNTIQGAKDTRRAAEHLGHNLIVITGEEITTEALNSEKKKIELLAYFLTETINPNMSIRKTLEAIKEQEGVVSVPHPYEFWRHGGMESAEQIIFCAEELELPLFWETFNSRSNHDNNIDALDFYRRNRRTFLQSVGSDAHHPGEVGRAYVALEKWEGRDTSKEQKQGFLESIAKPKGWKSDDSFIETAYFRAACKLGRLNPVANFPRSVSA